VLTPQAVDPASPFPYISNLSLNIGLTVESRPEDTLAGASLGHEVRFVRIKVPPVVPRLIPVIDGALKFALVEEVIEANIHRLFPNMHLSKGHLFRVTRDADVEIRDDKAADLLKLIKESLRERRFGLPVRLEVSSTMPSEMVDYLKESLRIESDDVYKTNSLLDVPVPSFLLQPIVENAVRHGVAPRVENGRITVGATRDGSALVLSVEDDGPGFDTDPFAVAGVGLSATRDRLALRYGAAGSIRCEARSADARGARVAIRVPLDGSRVL